MRCISLSLLAAALAPCPVLAGNSGTITFTGHVREQTCTATINGQDNATIALPDVSRRDFAASGTPAARTTFHLTLGNCNFNDDEGVKVKVYFTVPEGQVTEGDLNNTAPADTAATGIFIRLTEEENGTISQVPLKNNGEPLLGIMLMQRSGDGYVHTYHAQYVNHGEISSGTVLATVGYRVEYL